MERKNYQVRLSSGATVANPTVTVYNSGTVVLAPIFSDEGVTVKANPFTGDFNGQFYFYAADGDYDIVITGGTPDIGTYVLAVEHFEDLAGVAAAAAITTLNAQVGAVQTLVVGTAGADFNIASAANVHTFNLPTASNTKRGALSAADWTVFNSKIGDLNGLTNVAQTFAIGASGNAPSWVSAAGVHTLNLPVASAVKTGILSSADWSTFNNKLSLAAGNALQYVRGDLTMQTLNTAAVPESGNLYYTDARARLALSGLSPISYNNATGQISIQIATGAQPGYLDSADWTTFNNKMGSLNAQTAVVQTFALGTTGNDLSWSSGGGIHTLNVPSASQTARGVITIAAQDIKGVKTFYDHPLEVIDGRAIAIDDTFYIRTADLDVVSDNTEREIHSETWPAALSSGKVWNFFVGGTIKCSGANTITFKLYFGGTVVWNSGAIDPAAATAVGFYMMLNATIRTAGAAGVVQVNGMLVAEDSSTITRVINTNTAAVNLTGTPIIKITGQLSNSGVNDEFIISSSVWQAMG